MVTKRKASWKKFEGMESPGWYNIRYTKGKKEIILSNEDGSRAINTKWIVGYYVDDYPKLQRILSNKNVALRYAALLRKKY